MIEIVNWKRSTEMKVERKALSTIELECLPKKADGYKNEMRLEFRAISDNESFARTAVAAFVTQLNPTVEEISDVKTAVSEAVTNSVIHGYDGKDREENKVWIHCFIKNDVLEVEIKDNGIGIEDIEKAMEPLFTTKPELERSGMGFSFMEAFMDDLEVFSEVGQGTTVHMVKKLGITPWIADAESGFSD